MSGNTTPGPPNGSSSMSRNPTSGPPNGSSSMSGKPTPASAGGSPPGFPSGPPHSPPNGSSTHTSRDKNTDDGEVAENRVDKACKTHSSELGGTHSSALSNTQTQHELTCESTTSPTAQAQVKDKADQVCCHGDEGIKREGKDSSEGNNPCPTGSGDLVLKDVINSENHAGKALNKSLNKCKGGDVDTVSGDHENRERHQTEEIDHVEADIAEKSPGRSEKKLDEKDETLCDRDGENAASNQNKEDGEIKMRIKKENEETNEFLSEKEKKPSPNDMKENMHNMQETLIMTGPSGLSENKTKKEEDHSDGDKGCDEVTDQNSVLKISTETEDKERSSENGQKSKPDHNGPEIIIEPKTRDGIASVELYDSQEDVRQETEDSKSKVVDESAPSTTKNTKSARLDQGKSTPSKEELDAINDGEEIVSPRSVSEDPRTEKQESVGESTPSSSSDSSIKSTIKENQEKEITDALKLTEHPGEDGNGQKILLKSVDEKKQTLNEDNIGSRIQSVESAEDRTDESKETEKCKAKEFVSATTEDAEYESQNRKNVSNIPSSELGNTQNEHGHTGENTISPTAQGQVKDEAVEDFCHDDEGTKAGKDSAEVSKPCPTDSRVDVVVEDDGNSQNEGGKAFNKSSNGDEVDDVNTVSGNHEDRERHQPEQTDHVLKTAHVKENNAESHLKVDNAEKNSRRSAKKSDERDKKICGSDREKAVNDQNKEDESEIKMQVKKENEEVTEFSLEKEKKRSSNEVKEEDKDNLQENSNVIGPSGSTENGAKKEDDHSDREKGCDEVTNQNEVFNISTETEDKERTSKNEQKSTHDHDSPEILSESKTRDDTTGVELLNKQEDARKETEGNNSNGNVNDDEELVRPVDVSKDPCTEEQANVGVKTPPSSTDSNKEEGKDIPSKEKLGNSDHDKRLARHPDISYDTRTEKQESNRENTPPLSRDSNKESTIKDNQEKEITDAVKPIEHPREDGNGQKILLKSVEVKKEILNEDNAGNRIPSVEYSENRRDESKETGIEKSKTKNDAPEITKNAESEGRNLDKNPQSPKVSENVIHGSVGRKDMDNDKDESENQNHINEHQTVQEDGSGRKTAPDSKEDGSGRKTAPVSKEDTRKESVTSNEMDVGRSEKQNVGMVGKSSSDTGVDQDLNTSDQGDDNGRSRGQDTTSGRGRDVGYTIDNPQDSENLGNTLHGGTVSSQCLDEGIAKKESQEVEESKTLESLGPKVTRTKEDVVANACMEGEEESMGDNDGKDSVLKGDDQNAIKAEKNKSTSSEYSMIRNHQSGANEDSESSAGEEERNEEHGVNPTENQSIEQGNVGQSEMETYISVPEEILPVPSHGGFLIVENQFELFIDEILSDPMIDGNRNEWKKNSKRKFQTLYRRMIGESSFLRSDEQFTAQKRTRTDQSKGRDMKNTRVITTQPGRVPGTSQLGPRQGKNIGPILQQFFHHNNQDQSLVLNSVKII